MASTNKTTNLELSQYVSSDKPTYLVDYNSDMSKIDTGVHTAQVTADTASTAATNAQTTAEGAQTTANTAITNAATAQTAANGAVASIGTLANLETAEKTNLVGAINELVENVVNTDTVSTTKSYSTSFSDAKYKLKHEHAEKLIFDGTAGDGVACQINTTWAEIGVFSEMIVECEKTNINMRTQFAINFDLMSSGTDLYTGRRNTVVRVLCASGISELTYPTINPNNNVGSNTITFTNLAGLNVKRIYIIE